MYQSTYTHTPTRSMAFAHISTARAVLEQRLLACGGAIGVVKLEKKNSKICATYTTCMLTDTRL